jgi:hypothetical protein
MTTVFVVELDTTRGTTSHGGVAYSCPSPGLDGELGPLYQALAAGQYQVEGGFPCALCDGRHPAIRVCRDDGHGSLVVWRAP